MGSSSELEDMIERGRILGWRWRSVNALSPSLTTPGFILLTLATGIATSCVVGVLRMEYHCTVVYNNFDVLLARPLPEK